MHQKDYNSYRKFPLYHCRHLHTDIGFKTLVSLPLRSRMTLMSTNKCLGALLFQDDDMKSIRDLIDFAALDSGVKGGLRWPFGKATSGEKFSVIGAGHIVAKSYKNASLRLKVRDADRFDYRASIGEESGEIGIKLKRVVSELKVCMLGGKSKSSSNRSFYYFLRVICSFFKIHNS